MRRMRQSLCLPGVWVDLLAAFLDRSRYYFKVRWVDRAGEVQMGLARGAFLSTKGSATRGSEANRAGGGVAHGAC
jgi:hypothetical protein